MKLKSFLILVVMLHLGGLVHAYNFTFRNDTGKSIALIVHQQGDPTGLICHNRLLLNTQLGAGQSVATSTGGACCLGSITVDGRAVFIEGGFSRCQGGNYAFYLEGGSIRMSRL